jgi:low affinity Fe/Cu permease
MGECTAFVSEATHRITNGKERMSISTHVQNGATDSKSGKAFFSSLADAITYWAGSSRAFALAVLLIVIWGISGPFYNYSDTWQLLINSTTSIVTFLMVFLIQKTQNRDSRALHLKLNELLAAVEGASNRLINAEDLEEDTLRAIYRRFQVLAESSSSEDVATRARSVEEIEQEDRDAEAASAAQENGKAQ